jgi:hypothetical protein
MLNADFVGIAGLSCLAAGTATPKGGFIAVIVTGSWQIEDRR